MESSEKFCEVPNIKRGPNIRISYNTGKDIVTKFPEISGNTFLVGEQKPIGSYGLSFFPNQIEINCYYPLGRFFEDRDSWKALSNKGISQTFMFWLCKLAEANQRPIYIRTTSLLNDHIFKKWFAEDIRIINSRSRKNEKTHITTLRSTSLYDWRNVGEVEMRDLEYHSIVGYAKLQPFQGDTVFIKEMRTSYSNQPPEGLTEGVIGEINRRTSKFSVNGKELVIFSDIDLPGMEYSGHPKIPRWLDVEFKPKKIDQDGIVCLENII